MIAMLKCYLLFYKPIRESDEQLSCGCVHDLCYRYNKRVEELYNYKLL